VRRLRSVLLLPLLGLALLGAGCGGDGATVEEVPGPPATLTVPHQKGAADVSASATPTPTPGATGTATPTPAAGTTGSTGSTGTNTAATATPAPATQNSPAANATPAAGSPPQQFEQFCQENAGAC
jgi:hypothetical protein